MITKNNQSLKNCILILIVSLSVVSIGQSSTRPVAVMSKIIGDVKVDLVTQPGWKSAEWGEKLFNGDKLKTGQESFSSIIFLDRSLVKIRENSKFTIKSKRTIKRELDTEINLKVGELNLKVSKGSKFKIQTPTSVASVKGTELNLLVRDDGTTILTVIEGTVAFLNEMGEILATEMTTSIASVGESPSIPITIEKKALPTWGKKVKEDWKLNLIPDKPGKKDVGEPFNIQISVEDSKEGKTGLGFNQEVNLYSSGAGFVFSVDGGQSWASTAVLKLNKGKGIIKGKGISFGKTSLTVSGGNSIPGKLTVSLKRSKKAMSKIEGRASAAIKKIDPELAEKLAGKKMKSSKITKGAGSVESVLEAIESGQLEVTSKEIIENPDGTVQVILKVKSIGRGN